MWAKELKSYYALEDVCKEQNLHVAAMWGTLLGAIRHGGFIPWDDDIDAEMLHSEYTILERRAKGKNNGVKNALPEDYWISDYTFDERENLVRRWMSSKSLVEQYDLWKENYGFPFVGIIDIFLMEFLPIQKEDESRYWDVLHEAGNLKEQAKHSVGVGSAELDLGLRQLEKVSGYHFRKNSKRPLFIQILQAMDQFCLNYSKENCDYVALPAYYEKRNTLFAHKSLYEHYVEVSFEYGHMTVPVGYDGILRRYFGNYMVPRMVAGAHGYPAYDGMNKDAQKHTGFGLNEYTYDPDAITKVKNGRVSKPSLYEEISSTIELLVGAHEFLCERIESKSVDEEALDVLEQCQNLAITLGTGIEKRAVDSADAVSVLEQYCEHMYTLYQLLVGDRAPQNMTEAIQMIHDANCFTDSMYGIRDAIRECREVVFLVKRAEDWKSLHTLWEVACTDSRWRVYVIAIPYYYRKEDQQIDKESVRTDAGGVPSMVELTAFDQYDFENRHPAMIILQSPYDAYAGATPIHPFFYAENLYRFTDRMVLIPQFRLKESFLDREQVRFTVGTYLKTPGGVLADRLVVQSSKMKEVYMDIFDEWESMDETAEICDRIVAYGLPLDDYTARLEKSRAEEKKREYPKKVVLYTLGASMLYQYGMKGIEKAKKICKMVEEYSDKVQLVWCEDPYAEEILIYAPNIRKAYEEVKDGFVQNGGVFVDLKREMCVRKAGELCVVPAKGDRRATERAMAGMADAMYGDGGTLMNECRMHELPVMLETPWVDSLEDSETAKSWNPADMVVMEQTLGNGWTFPEFLQTVISSKMPESAGECSRLIWKSISSQQKKIAIVYELDRDGETARTIQNAIAVREMYDAFLCPLDAYHEIGRYYDAWWKEGMPEMILTINLAGFELRNTGGNSMYSMYNGNCVHYVDRDVENEKELLRGLLPITMRFVTDTKERYERMRNDYRRIHEIDVSGQIAEDIFGIIDCTDWRM
ncbi:MAG: LicD family protein [Eubacterium sp.]|nr:LicD family protein [Eubacterium sp.]